MTAIDSSFETVSVVFLIAAMIYSYKLSRLAKDAEIIALGKPKTVFNLMLIAFFSLFLSQFLSMANDVFYAVPYVDEISQILIIVTAFTSVVGIYTALYYYRTSPGRLQTT